MEIIIDKDTVLPDDMTQEELDDLLIELQRLADSGELFENSIELDEIELDEIELDEDQLKIDEFFKERELDS